jgi:hypothetical protein
MPPSRVSPPYAIAAVERHQSADVETGHAGHERDSALSAEFATAGAQVAQPQTQREEAREGRREEGPDASGPKPQVSRQSRRSRKPRRGDLTSTQLMAEMLAAGAFLWPEGDLVHYRAPRGFMTDERKAAFLAHMPRLLALLHREIGWRTQAMWEQACQMDPLGPEPFLVARQTTSVVPGLSGRAAESSRCLSCGKPMCKQGNRCELCVAATERVLAQWRAAEQETRRCR